MVASLLRPLTDGIQDERLYELDGSTFHPFLKKWNPTTRFTTQLVRLDFDSAPAFGTTAVLTLVPKGQLITRLYLVANMPNISTPQIRAQTYCDTSGVVFAGPKFGWTNSVGHALVASTSIDIGNTRCDTLDSRLLEMLDEYYNPIEKTTVINRMIKRRDNGFTQESFGRFVNSTQVIVPLPFWFAREDPACALPIDAIRDDRVRLNVSFRSLQGMYYTDSRNYRPMTAEQRALNGSRLWPLPNSPFYYRDVSGVIVPGIDPVNPVSVIPGIVMPDSLGLLLGETFIIAEYVYLDQPEANRFRIGDLQIPFVQHYAMNPYQTRGLMRGKVELNIPNPTSAVFWMANRVDAPQYNAFFLATRDLSGIDMSGTALWWPNATGLEASNPGFLRPGFQLSDSEPFTGMGIIYEGRLVRARTEAPCGWRAIIPSWEFKKSPWINGYYYAMSLGNWPGYTAETRPRGEANLDRIQRRELIFELAPKRGTNNPNDVESYVIYCWAETYNILRVYGGRAGILFAWP
jgi:hypothetical protein